MIIAILNRVVETVIGGGTGTLTLTGAQTGYRSFATEMPASGRKVYYTITDNPKAPNVYEYGIGTWTSPDQLSRDTVLGSSSGGSKISLAGGTTYTVSATLPKEAFVPRGALVTRVTNKSINNNVSTAIDFTAEQYDTDDIFTIGTSAFNLTVPVGADSIRLHGKCGFAANATGFRLLDIFAGGVALSTAFGSNCRKTIPSIGSAADTFVQIETPRLVNPGAGTNFTLVALQNSGGALNVNPVSFEMEILG